MCREKRSSKPCLNEHDLEKETKGKNSASKVVMKIPDEKAFPTDIKPSKCPAKELEKATEEKRQKKGGEKAKGRGRNF